MLYRLTQLLLNEFGTSNRNLEVRTVEWSQLSSAEQIRLLADTDIFLGFGGTDIINTMFLPRFSSVIIPWKLERGRYRYSDDMYVWFSHKPYQLLKEFEVYINGRLGNKTSAFLHDTFVASPIRRVWYSRERAWQDDHPYFEWNRTTTAASSGRSSSSSSLGSDEDDAGGAGNGIITEGGGRGIVERKRIHPVKTVDLPRQIWLDADAQLVEYVRNSFAYFDAFGVRFKERQED